MEMAYEMATDLFYNAWEGFLGVVEPHLPEHLHWNELCVSVNHYFFTTDWTKQWKTALICCPNSLLGKYYHKLSFNSGWYLVRLVLIIAIISKENVFVQSPLPVSQINHHSGMVLVLVCMNYLRHLR